MKSQKLVRVLEIISENLAEKDIPYSLIGAMALGIYGLPRFTADIDLLTDGAYWNLISPIMERLGYTCFQKTNSFAQFDSELGVLGKIDFMFVNTPEGKKILKRSILFEDELLGSHPVIQPVDYIVLKLMAIVNNPSRALKDEGDIFELLQLSREGLLPPEFESPDRARIFYFADRFKQRERIEKIFNTLDENPHQTEGFKL